MIYLFLANGFEEIEALCPLDLLRRAGLEVTTVGIGGDLIKGSHGIAVQADIPDTMYRDSKPEMIILPGGMPGAKNLDESRIVDSALGAAASSGGYLAAICAAPMVLGKRGYLEGKNATCFPGFEEFLTGATVAPSHTREKLLKAGERSLPPQAWAWLWNSVLRWFVCSRAMMPPRSSAARCLPTDGNDEKRASRATQGA